jgi:hypothetical protein
MKELFELSFTPANLLATICLMLVVVYWLVFLVGLLDLSFLDIDIGHDHDIDLEHDLDHDLHAGKEVGKHMEVGAHSDQGFGAKVLGFFNLGHVPLMVIFSFFALFFWTISILGNYYLAGHVWILNVAVFVGGVVGAAFLAKVITQPLKSLFKKMYQEELPIDMRGRICEIEIGPEGTLLGQATLQVKDKSININVRSDSGKRIAPTTKCVVLEHFEAEDYYIVAPLDQEPQTSNPSA